MKIKKLLSIFFATIMIMSVAVLPISAESSSNEQDEYILINTDFINSISPISPLANLCTNCGGQIGVKRFYQLSYSVLGTCAYYRYPYEHRTMTVMGQKTCGSCGSVFSDMYTIESYEYCCYTNSRATHSHF